jgi:hypothetical protein
MHRRGATAELPVCDSTNRETRSALQKQREVTPSAQLESRNTCATVAGATMRAVDEVERIVILDAGSDGRVHAEVNEFDTFTITLLMQRRQLVFPTRRRKFQPCFG